MSLSIASCAKQDKLMEVDLFNLRNTEIARQETGMVRGDQNYILHGKISAKERELAKGQYYTVSRKIKEKKATIVFHYLQVATKSKVLTKKQTLEPNQAKAEFHITGENFKQNGRVLAWKAELIEEGKIIASEQSYMWD